MTVINPARREEITLDSLPSAQHITEPQSLTTDGSSSGKFLHTIGDSDFGKSNTRGTGRAIVPTASVRRRNQRIARQGKLAESSTNAIRQKSRLAWHQRIVSRVRRFAESPGGVLISGGSLILMFGLSPLIVNYSVEEPSNNQQNVVSQDAGDAQDNVVALSSSAIGD